MNININVYIYIYVYIHRYMFTIVGRKRSAEELVEQRQAEVGQLGLAARPCARSGNPQPGAATLPQINMEAHRGPCIEGSLKRGPSPLPC